MSLKWIGKIERKLTPNWLSTFLDDAACGYEDPDIERQARQRMSSLDKARQQRDIRRKGGII